MASAGVADRDEITTANEALLPDGLLRCTSVLPEVSVVGTAVQDDVDGDTVVA